MKPHHPRSTALRFLPLAVLLALGCLGMYLSLATPVPEGKPAAYPGWWFEREAITRTDPAKASPVHPADYPPAADFAALNQGQLKQFATAAFDELRAHLPGGAGPAITALVQCWYVLEGDAFKLDAKGRRIPLVTGKINNFAPVNHGQLKELARHFFDRLQAELYYPTGQPYPWDAPAAQPVADYAVANLGQVKSLFQFDLATDSDQDAIPDWWEKAHGLNHKNRNDALALSEAGLVTNLAAYRNNLDPGAELTSLQLASVSALSSVTFTVLTKSLGLSASTALKPGPSPLVLNGDFQKDVNGTGIGYSAPPGGNLIDRRRWYPRQQSSSGWTAIGGKTPSPSTSDSRVDRMQIEVQQQISDYLLPPWFMDDSTPPVNRSGCLNQYCELDAHWERYVKLSNGTEYVITSFNEEGKSHRQHNSDHGIKQNVTVDRGNYILIFDYRGRPGVKNTFKVWVESTAGSTDLVTAADIRPSVSPTPPTTAEVSTTAWKRAMVSFKVEGGNAIGNQIALKFDLEDPVYDADSYGAWIDNVILLRPAITNVSFEAGSAGGNYHQLTSDDGSYAGATFTPTTVYSAPQWVDGDGDGQATPTTSGDKNYPIAFTKNTKMKVGATMKVSGVTSSSSVKIKATITGGANIPETTVTPASDGTITLSATETSANLVNQIKFYNANDSSNFDIDWEINVNNTGWATIETTTHTVYLTYDNPLGGKTQWQETLFDIGCRNADGKTAKDDTVDAIWSRFSGRNVSRVDAATRNANRDNPDGMVYWKVGGNGAVAYEKFLMDGNGSCGSWADFLVAVLGAQGISSGVSEVVPPTPLDEAAGFPNALAKYKTEKLPPGTTSKVYLDGTQPGPSGLTVGDVFLSPDSNNGSVNHGIFFVKATWDFTKTFMNISDWTAPLTEQTGSAAQGNTNARAYFGNHAIVLYTRTVGGATYYDPSYGGGIYSGTDRKKNLEDASLKAFGALFQVFVWSGSSWDSSGYYVWYERDNPPGTLECTISP